MIYDYLVIGAGFSGLTASAILAKHGFKVALIERSKKTAPVARGFVRNGIPFDTGFHYTGGLEENGILDILLRYLSIPLEKEALDNEGFDVFHCIDPGFDFAFPTGYQHLKEALRRAFPHDHRAIELFLAGIFDIYSSLPYINLDAPLFPSRWASAVHDKSLQDVLDGLTENRLLKCLLSMHCLLHGVAPNEISYRSHACVVAPYYGSAHRVRGGGCRIANAFDERLRGLGVEILAGRTVREIRLSSNGIVRGVRLEDGEEVDGSNCVATVHPRQMLKMVDGSFFRPAYRSRIEGLEESSSAYVLFGTTDEVIDPLVGRNHFVFASQDFPLLDGSVPVEERPIYITAAGEDADRGKALMALCPSSLDELTPWSESRTGNRPEGYITHKEHVGRQLLRRIDALGNGFSGHRFSTECATPLTLRDYSGSPFGSLYGIKHRVGQYDPLPATHVKNLFLTGQATAAPGLLGAMISACLTCGTILGHENLREELKRCRNDA